ncbi:MAG: hypothetical protein IJ583_15645, partial [Firmicutes bacterium]|nr:hypothetical protein [Bacillota bacterium]
GAFLIPNRDANVSAGSSAGWLATGGKATNHAEWHYIYEGTSEDTNSDTEGQIHFAARKAFTNAYAAKETIEDMTAFSEKGDYKFHFYETGADYSTDGMDEIVKYDKNDNEQTIVNEATNKIKFPVLTFYTSDEDAPSGKEKYVVSENSSKTYYYVIKEYNSGEVVDGIYNSDGEIDIKLVVKNTDGVLTYTVSSTTYLYSGKSEKSIYKENTDVNMSGIEFSLGAFFNLENYNYISKREIADGEELPGATLRLKGEDENGDDIIFADYMLTEGNGIEILSSEGDELSWISGDEAMLIKGLPNGTYTLTELTAPKGYQKAEKVNFTVKDGKITSVTGSDSAQAEKTVIMLDKPEDTDCNYISKRAVVDGDELPGATLLLKGVDENGKDIIFNENMLTKADSVEIKTSNGDELSWISGNKAMAIKGLPDGIYTLTEITAPKGYQKAEKVKFTVVDGKISSVIGEDSAQDGNTVIMLDAPEETSSTETTTETTTNSTTETTTEATTKTTT